MPESGVRGENCRQAQTHKHSLGGVQSCLGLWLRSAQVHVDCSREQASPVEEQSGEVCESPSQWM